MSKTKQLTYAALCVALGIILPITMHSIPNSGSVLLPMHIPVLLCGLICGWPYALLCGVVTPTLSSILTGMPPAAYLPSMLCELAVYGFAASLLLRFVRTKSNLADLYIALIGSMLAGRVVAGILNALIFNVGNYSMQIWVTRLFINSLPGIVIQLVLLPVVVQALTKAKIVTRN